MIRRAVLSMALIAAFTYGAFAAGELPPLDDGRPEFALILPNAPGLQQSIRPLVRPGTVQPVISASARLLPPLISAPGRSSVRPEPRPDDLVGSNTKPQTVSAARKSSPATRGKDRKLCRDKSIQGKKMTPIYGRLKGCVIPEPVQVSSVGGVFLTTPAIMDCTTAKALDSWVENGVKPAVNKLGGGVASLQVISHYSCRTVNSKPGGKLSEHGKGHAIDISAINLKDGTSLTVLRGWRNKAHSKIMRIMHATACGPFKTVLGPNADRYHQDHFHLDTKRRSSKSYCR